MTGSFSQQSYEELIEAVGGFGKYQRCSFGVLSIAAVIAAVTFLCNTMLTDGTPEYRCMVPADVKQGISKECNNTWTEYQNDLSVPWNNQSNEHDHCNRLLVGSEYNNTDCAYWFPASVNGSFSQKNQTGFNSTKCSEWNFSSNNFHSTVDMTFRLVCENPWKRQMASLALMTGVLIGSFLFGSCCDRFGRKPTLLVGMLIMCMSEFSSTFVANYVAYCLLMLCLGAAFMGTTVVGFILVMEIIAQRYHSPVGIGLQCCFSVGQMLLALLGFLARDWRTVGRITSSLFTAFLLFFIKFAIESPRWLSANQRLENANAVLRKIADFNSREHKLLILRQENESQTEKEKEHLMKEETTEDKAVIWDLFRNSTLRKITLILSYNWFVATAVYYGLSLTATELGGDVFLSIFFSGLIEIPGNAAAAYLTHAWGRRPVIFLFHVISAISLCCMLCTRGTYWADLLLFLIAKSGTTGAFSGLYLYTAELYPTPNRGIGVGFCCGIARFGGVFAIVLLSLSPTTLTLPYVIFGILGLLAGVLIGLLPETKGNGFPEKTEDCETMYEKRAVSLKSQCCSCFWKVRQSWT